MASVSARIRCEIEVEVGKWNPSATFGELREQVMREGSAIVEKMLTSQSNNPRGMLVPGSVAVRFVIVGEDKQ